jgi:DNA invertase Pin-like site-specific DNA recombinase
MNTTQNVFNIIFDLFGTFDYFTYLSVIFKGSYMKAVIFARVSSTTDRQSTERQVVDLKSYANKNDFQVVKVFEEKISGGKRNEEREILLECIDYCIVNKVDTLLTSELSRIGRNTLQVLKTLDVLHSNGINVYIQNLGLNTLTKDKEINPMTSIITTVMSELYSIERGNIQYRLNSGRENYIAKGGRLGRNVGSTKSKDIKKEEYKEALALLRKGYAIRKVAKITDNSVSTVQRLKKEFAL